MKTGTQAEFARFLGVNRSTVNRALDAGRLVLAGDGKIDFEQSVRRYAETKGGRTDVEARHAAKRGSAIQTNGDDEKNALWAEEGHSEQDDSRQKARALILQYENNAIKIEMALRRGKRLNRSSVAREAHGIGSLLRSGVERLIDLCAPRLAATTDQKERRRILVAEVSHLRAISGREFPQALRRLRDDAAGKNVESGS